MLASHRWLVTSTAICLMICKVTCHSGAQRGKFTLLHARVWHPELGSTLETSTNTGQTSYTAYVAQQLTPAGGYQILAIMRLVLAY